MTRDDTLTAPAPDVTVAAEPAREHGTVRPGAGFWLAAFAFAAAMGFSAAPAPLYVLYQRQDHFTPLTVTVVFAAYAVGVVASLLLAGHLSDGLGRRRVLLPAVLTSALAGLVFLHWTSLPGLLTARVLSGLAVGAITATATAYLAELDAESRSGVTRRAALVATAANLGGIGLGPLVAGLVADASRLPLQTPYLVFTVVLVLAALGLTFVPETAPLPTRLPPYRVQRVAVPRHARGRFAAAAASLFAAFAVFGLFTSLGPSFVAGTLHHTSHAVAGAVTFSAFGAAAAGQALLGRWSARAAVLLGLPTTVAGLFLVTAVLWWPSLPVLVAGGILAGGGAGLVVKGSLTTIAALAPSTARAETLAGGFVAAYTGLAVPVVGLGLAATVLGTRPALVGFASLVAVLATAATVAGRRPRAVRP